MGIGKLRHVALAVLATVSLAGCSGQMPDGFALLAQTLGQGPEPSRFEVSREEIAAAGITQPLVRIVSRVPVVQSSGYLSTGTANGTTFYTANDASSVLLAGGLLRSTVNFRGDLESAQTTPTARALSAGGGSYERVVRHRRGEGKLFETRLTCSVTGGEATRIVILGKAHDTRRFSEACQAGARDPAGRLMAFENTFWLENGQVRASEQWVSYETQMLRIEQVLP